jgi:hypothetical protein
MYSLHTLVPVLSNILVKSLFTWVKYSITVIHSNVSDLQVHSEQKLTMPCACLILFSFNNIFYTAGVTGQQGMLTPPWHLVPPLIYSEVRVRPFSELYFL